MIMMPNTDRFFLSSFQMKQPIINTCPTHTRSRTLLFIRKKIQDIKKEFREGGLNLKYITRIWIAKKKEEK